MKTRIKVIERIDGSKSYRGQSLRAFSPWGLYLIPIMGWSEFILDFFFYQDIDYSPCENITSAQRSIDRFIENRHEKLRQKRNKIKRVSYIKHP